MNDLLPLIVGGLCTLTLVTIIIVGSHCLANPRWYRCRWCGEYVSDTGCHRGADDAPDRVSGDLLCEHCAYERAVAERKAVGR